MNYRTALAVLGAAFILSSTGSAASLGAAISPQLTSPVAANVATTPDVLRVQYFRNANTGGIADQAVDVVDPGTNGAANLCVMIYVVTSDEELNECCGCLITPDQLQEYRLNANLTANPGNGVTAHNGVIKIISSALTPAFVPSPQGGQIQFPTCDPGNPIETPTLRAWITHVTPITGAALATEEEFSGPGLSADEKNFLAGTCAFFEHSLSGKGRCTCPGQLPI